MRLTLMATVLCIAAAASGQTSDVYSRYFGTSTMRVDYYHTGIKGEERFSLDRVYEEGPWPDQKPSWWTR